MDRHSPKHAELLRNNKQLFINICAISWSLYCIDLRIFVFRHMLKELSVALLCR
jgi:hypothetical protein